MFLLLLPLRCSAPGRPRSRARWWAGPAAAAAPSSPPAATPRIAPPCRRSIEPTAATKTQTQHEIHPLKNSELQTLILLLSSQSTSLPLKQRNRRRFGRKQGRCVGQAASRIFASSIERPLLLLRVCPKCTSLLPTSLQSLSLHFREAEQKLAPDRIEDRREKQLQPVCLGDQLGWN